MPNDMKQLNVLNFSRIDKICMANGNTVHFNDIGSGLLSSKDDTGKFVEPKLNDIMYVSDLMSISKMADDRFTLLFNKHDCSILRAGQVVVVGVRVENLYRLKLNGER